MRGVLVRQRDAIFPCIGIAASILVGFHALIDFSLQIPAVAITYVFLLGVGVAQSRSSRVNTTKTPNAAQLRLAGMPDSPPDQ
jgi:hypothetical protein